MCQILISDNAGEELRGWQVKRTTGCSIDKEGSRGRPVPTVLGQRGRNHDGQRPPTARAGSLVLGVRI